MAHDREVGGIRCLEVLTHLSEYVDGEVTVELRRRIDDHLRGCDWCERFGGEFSATVVELRQLLHEPPGVDRETQERLMNRLGLGEDRSS